MTILLSMQTLVAACQMKLQATADVLGRLEVRLDTPVFSLDVYYYSLPLLLQFFFFLMFGTKQLVLSFSCHNIRWKKKKKSYNRAANTSEN